MNLGTVGETAAITTSFLWTISSLFFTAAGKKIGVLNVNAYRLIIAIAFIFVTHFVLLGTLAPLASTGQWFWLGLSGIVGLGIGDMGLFAAYVTIGPRRSLLMMALAPIFAAATAYLMLGETIPELALAGIAVTLIGVIIVILESDPQAGYETVPGRRKAYGIIFGLIAGMGQGVGLVLAKIGIYLNPDAILDPISATLMRLLLGGVFVWAVALISGRLLGVFQAARNREGMKNTVAASFVGPYLGITLSMVAATFTDVGIAQTLLSLMPVMIIPMVWVTHHQRTSLRGILGAVVAVVGVSIIFLS